MILSSRANVFFKSGKTSERDIGKIRNIRLGIPGPRLFAEANHSSYEASVAESVYELERKLARRKEKMKRS